MNWILDIFEMFFGNDSKYFLIGAWMTAIFMAFGGFWALLGTALAAGFVYVAEYQVFGSLTMRDMRSVVLGGLVTLLIGILFLP